jgi:hypothetical protein
MLVVVIDIHYRDTASRGGCYEPCSALTYSTPIPVSTQQLGEAVRAKHQAICERLPRNAAFSDADLPSKAPTLKALC